MQVSVCIPSYNEGAGLIRLLREVAEQETNGLFRIAEIVISDDSSDNTPALVNAFASAEQDFLPLKMLHHENRRGQPAAWNELIREAKGEILVLLDGDVAIQKRTIHSLIRRFRVEERLGLVAGNVLPYKPASFAGKASYLVGLWLQRLREKPRPSPFTVIGRCVAVKKSLLAEVVFPRNVIASDLYLACRILEGGYDITWDSGAVTYFYPAESFRDFASQTIRALMGHRQLKNYTRRVFTNESHLSEQLVEALRVIRRNKLDALALLAAYGLMPAYVPRVLKGASRSVWDIAFTSKFQK